jgi:hypothetical protein
MVEAQSTSLLYHRQLLHVMAEAVPSGVSDNLLFLSLNYVKMHLVSLLWICSKALYTEIFIYIRGCKNKKEREKERKKEKIQMISINCS